MFWKDKWAMRCLHNERKTMKEMSGQLFYPKLIYAMETPRFLIMASEYHPAGDLRTVQQKFGFLPRPHNDILNSRNIFCY